MPPDPSSFNAINIPTASIPAWMGSFTLSAPPNTDLWRKPPGQDTFTAPIIYTTLRQPFVTAEVTVSADWEFEWDQGGLVIFAGAQPFRNAITQRRGPQLHARPETNHSQAPPSYSQATASAKWVKLGLEYCNGECCATSVCAAPDGADWAIMSLPKLRGSRAGVRIRIERIGYALWLWYADEYCNWRKIRELAGFFYGVEDKSVRVGVWASRPANLESANSDDTRCRSSESPPRNLCVEFEDLEIF